MPAPSVPPWTPAKGDIGDVGLVAPRSPLAHWLRPFGDAPLRLDDALEHCREDEEIHELGIELGTASRADDVHASGRRLGAAIAAAVRHGVEGIGDGDDARRQWNAASLELPGIPGAVPLLVVGQDAIRQLRVEAVEWTEHFGAAFGMRGDGSALGAIEALLVVDDVEERLVNLADVMKQRDALDHFSFVIVHAGRVGENQCVRGDAADVGAGLRIVRIDRVQERLEACGGESLSGAAGGVGPAVEQRDGGSR